MRTWRRSSASLPNIRSRKAHGRRRQSKLTQCFWEISPSELFPESHPSVKKKPLGDHEKCQRTWGSAWRRSRSRHRQRASDRPSIPRLLAGLQADGQVSSTSILLAVGLLASLDNVVTYGCPPLAIRICSLVSGKSLPATVGFGGAGVDGVAGSWGRGAPSLRAFSLAAFSARSFLSASIWALTFARAFASSSFSASHFNRPYRIQIRMTYPASFSPSPSDSPSP